MAPVVDPSAGPITPAELDLFADPGGFASGSVCVFEPPLVAQGPGALYPGNWQRPRFRWQSSGGERLWEIRLTGSSAPCTLRAYTRSTEWVMPQELWAVISQRVIGRFQVTIRGVSAGGALVGSSGSFEIAPAFSDNALVFSALSSGELTYLRPPRLLQLNVGDDAATELLRPADIQSANVPEADGALLRGTTACRETAQPTCAECCLDLGHARCIGCHALTPDGKAVAFSEYDDGNELTASIAAETRGALPVTVTPHAARLLRQPWLGMPVFSPAHFSMGDRRLLTTYGLRANPATTPYDPSRPARFGLAWFDLDANSLTAPIPEEIPLDPPLVGQFENAYQVRDQRNAAVGAAYGSEWGLLTTLGESQSVASPAWSHDGEQIVYVSTELATTSGGLAWAANSADIRRVPYQNGQGGPTSSLGGASDPNFLEYAPAFSPDDALLAFTRAPTPSVLTRCVPTQDANGALVPCPAQDLGDNPDGPYYNRNGEIYVLPSAGGDAIRLAANDPVACSGETSRGSINSGAQWASSVQIADGKRYYFLVFSSARGYPGAFQVPGTPLSPPVSRASSQLYLTAVVVDEATGAVETRPAIYIANQGERLADGQASALGAGSSSNFNARWLP